MTGDSPVHWVYVWSLPEFDRDDVFADAEWTLTHPLGCTDDDRCPVLWQAQEGLLWTLNYSGTPITEPGGYAIVAWVERIPLAPHIGTEEWDAGVALPEGGWRAGLPLGSEGPP